MEYRHEFIMPEHLLLEMIDEYNFNYVLTSFYSPHQLKKHVKTYLAKVETMPDDTEYEAEAS